MVKERAEMKKSGINIVKFGINMVISTLLVGGTIAGALLLERVVENAKEESLRSKWMKEWEVQRQKEQQRQLEDKKVMLAMKELNKVDLSHWRQTEFVAKLYREAVAKHQGNIILSPYGVASVFTSLLSKGSNAYASNYAKKIKSGNKIYVGLTADIDTDGDPLFTVSGDTLTLVKTFDDGVKVTVTFKKAEE